MLNSMHGARFKNYDVLHTEETTARCQSPLRRSFSDTSGKSVRHSLRASDSSSEPELSESTPGANQRSARDPARVDLELVLNLVLSETWPISEASSRHPPRTANANAFSDASEQMHTSSQRRLQSLHRQGDKGKQHHLREGKAAPPQRSEERGSTTPKMDAGSSTTPKGAREEGASSRQRVKQHRPKERAEAAPPKKEGKGNHHFN